MITTCSSHHGHRPTRKDGRVCRAWELLYAWQRPQRPAVRRW